jgi:CarboxypepD_reg-like domain/TonB-dependent Receptor Plug Domain
MLTIKRILLFISLISPLWSIAQQKFSISGSIKDITSGEELIGAAVLVKEIPGTGVVANAYGFYSIELPTGEYTIRFQYTGYELKEQKIKLDKNLKLNVEMKPKSSELKEVEISAEKPDESLSRVNMGVEKLSAKEIKMIPVLFGEADLLKTLQLLPGVKSAGEGNTGFFVRGGSADQNLILLDEAPVYNASHLLGFFSVFNSDAVKEATLYKGTMPTEFGGRIASVLDVKMNEGNQKKLNVLGGVGLIASRLTVEAPIVKDKSSFIVSGRRTYADMFLKLSADTNLRKSTLYFYDLNAKLNYKISDKDRIFISGYFGRDNFGFSDQFRFDWGNATGTIRWNHLFSDKLFSNTSLIYSDYNYKIKLSASDFDVEIGSTIRDWNLKQDYQYYQNNKSTIKFGWNSIYHTFMPGEVNGVDFLNNLTNDRRYAWENAAYVSHQYQFNKKLSIDYGLRLSAFSYIGPGAVYEFDTDGNITSERQAANGEFIQNYFNPEPRFSINYRIDSLQSIKGGYSRTVQNLHLLSNTTSGNPTDIWIPSSNNVKPELGDQYSAGYFRNLKNNKFEFSAETYYKWMANQIDYRNGAELILNQEVEGELVYGTGRAYGLELLVRKKAGKFTGWIGYTLSRTERKFDEIDNGNYFAARQDRTHDLTVVAMYELNNKWALSANFVYYTGNAVTFPSGKYEMDGQVINYYSERNGYRMPAYHRLDLGATYYRKRTDTYESSWSFSLYNAYGRENAYTISFRESDTNPGQTEAVQLSLFRWIPSITYNFHFK